MKTRYGPSKLLLGCASFLAFSGIAAWVSIGGPGGESSTSAAQPAVVQSATSDDADQASDNTAQRLPVSRRAPVARSRGT